MAYQICPNCGAELHNTQGYYFVCEFCGTQAPVDSQTRAMIDAQQRQRMFAQQYASHKATEKKLKKVGLITIISIVALIAIIVGFNIYSNNKAKNELAETRDKYQQAKQDIISGNPQSAYISASDVFVTDNPESIGHLNQNLIETLKKKGYVEEGALTYSYYAIDKDVAMKHQNDHHYREYKDPLIIVKINTYKNDIFLDSERLNETDKVHSVTITINNNDLKNVFVDNFKKDLRNIGFTSNSPYSDNYNVVDHLYMGNFGLTRTGTEKVQIDTTFFSEYFIDTKKKISVNWEGVETGSYANVIVCVGFRQF